MADKWSGPRVLAQVAGLVDSATKVPSDRGGERIRLEFVDVTLTYTDETAEERESFTVFVAEKGAPGIALAGTIRKVAGLKANDPGLLEAIEGKRVTASVEHRDFQTKDGSTATMAIYRVTAVEGAGAEVGHEAVAGYLIGKTPAEASRGRAALGSYAQTLTSKTKTLEAFPELVLAEGKYALA